MLATTMRKITVNKWKVNFEGKEIEESLLSALSVLITSRKPELQPKGLDKFRIYGRLAKAFDKAEETGVLELEESEYKFLKDIIEEDIPSVWGSNKNISQAIDSFLDAKE